MLLSPVNKSALYAGSTCTCVRDSEVHNVLSASWTTAIHRDSIRPPTPCDLLHPDCTVPSWAALRPSPCRTAPANSSAVATAGRRDGARRGSAPARWRRSAARPGPAASSGARPRRPAPAAEDTGTSSSRR